MGGKAGVEAVKKKWIAVRTDGKSLDCDTVILVGAMAVEQDGHITMLSTNVGQQTKHEFHALAQMAFIQFQDEELDVTPVDGPIKVSSKNGINEIRSGMAICRTNTGSVSVMAHRDLPRRKLLQAAHRNCTRWIRLDI
jgi:hypothetical protein